ncbi:ribokinase [Salinibacillus kushneri]|uniref:Ribokinase n=1 Tax=Salinibacillus kushneri TaxID=237682 RepID=A0A1H9Z051_9BACI|nr:ribokinase [Salinibacillus kushneri]SES74832.1 ribokinase [Salinibacillus kushneri]
MSVTVVGSINIDTVAVTDVYPERGQTIFGKKIEYFPGGKGANQATAVARLGKPVNMIGAVGQDLYGDKLIHSLQDSKVDTHFIKRSETFATGTAIITIDQTAENTMLVLKGANDDLRINDIESAFNQIDASDVLLVQMEVPQETVIRSMEMAKEKGMYVVLDPAPAEGITVKALDYADIITPNQQETYHMLGVDVTDIDSALEAAEIFEGMGVSNSIIKMGAHGSVVYQKGNWEYIEPISVKAVDSVGAGDAFAGALACAISDGYDTFSAARFATVVGALKVTKLGAQVGIPTIDEVNAFCRERGLTKHQLKKTV